VEIVRRLYEHWARGDHSAPGFYDPEVEFSRTAPEGSGVSGRWRGIEGGVGRVRRVPLRICEYRVEAERIIDVDDERVLVLSRNIARVKRSGVPTVGGTIVESRVS
jgi:hypothetical protein